MKLLIPILLLTMNILSAGEIVRGRTIQVKGKTVALQLKSSVDEKDELAPLVERMAATYFTYWPKVVDWLGLPVEGTPTSIIVTFSDELPHPARAAGNRIEVSTKHLIRDPADTEGLFVHELSHVIQAYPHGTPTWFIEGSADFVRFKAFPDSIWAKQNREHGTDKSQPFGHYWKSTAFLLWIEETYKKSVIKEISQHARNATYRDEHWQDLTGKTLTELADEYSKSFWEPPLK